VLIPDFELLYGPFFMPPLPQSIHELFQAHQARLTSIAAVPQASGLSARLREISATSLSKQIQDLVKVQYKSDSAAGTTPEDKIAKLATSVSNLAKQVRPLSPNDAFFEAFTTGSVAAAQEVCLSFFGLSWPS
jgi:hypothetical protein